MTKIKTVSKLVSEFKRHNYGAVIADEGETPSVPTAKVLADDWGIRIRRNADAKAFGPGVYEISGSYFYQSQQECTRLFRELVEFGAQHGWRVEQIRWERWRLGPVITLDTLTKDDLSFRSAQWPQSSWAVAYVRITKKEIGDV